MRLIDADIINFEDAIKGASNFAIDTRNFAKEVIDCQPTVEVPTWIPCSERLPEESRPYLVWYHDGFGNTGYYVLHWDNGRKGFYPKWFHNTSRHELAWSVLPQPYEQK